ncbi:hypothetical protein BDZ91DRAFT_725446 [Kalaharituber pfeilii]|nr:hypothetical protein BDZ91DRAFT_725446 [Kalaharituber pfeilii]
MVLLQPLAAALQGGSGFLLLLLSIGHHLVLPLQILLTSAISQRFAGGPSSKRVVIPLVDHLNGGPCVRLHRLFPRPPPERRVVPWSRI